MKMILLILLPIFASAQPEVVLLSGAGANPIMISEISETGGYIDLVIGANPVDGENIACIGPLVRGSTIEATFYFEGKKSLVRSVCEDYFSFKFSKNVTAPKAYFIIIKITPYARA